MITYEYTMVSVNPTLPVSRSGFERVQALGAKGWRVVNVDTGLNVDEGTMGQLYTMERATDRGQEPTTCDQ